VAQVIYSEEAFADFERIIDFLLESSPDQAARALEDIRGAISILESHPLIGRRVDANMRELVISRGASGYIALYRAEPALDLIRVLRIRHQREAGYME
jgi:plasmid stabilization system protein ParE